VLHSRITRVEELVKNEIGQILLTEMKDPRLGFVTVCRAKISKDLRRGQIYVSFLDEESAEESMAALNSARGFIRKRLGERVTLRYLPDIEFIRDDSARHAQRISRVIEELHEKEAGSQHSQIEEDASDEPRT
jgi:ribosome-binding factor A